MPLFTLGHSTLTEREFVQAARGIDVILDVRSHPGSRHVPQFNKEEMERWLPQFGIAYEWWPGLGGWTARHCEDRRLQEAMAAVGVDIAAYSRGTFPRQRIGVARPADQPNGSRPVWTNQGLYDYAWFTAQPEFLAAADQLIAQYGARSGIRAAIVCCESCWWKCHRSMIADYLHFRETPCYHLPVKPPKRETTPRYKPHADAIGNRLERYPVEVLAAWVRQASSAADEANRQCRLSLLAR